MKKSRKRNARRKERTTYVRRSSHSRKENEREQEKRRKERKKRKKRRRKKERKKEREKKKKERKRERGSETIKRRHFDHSKHQQQHSGHFFSSFFLKTRNA